MSKNNIYQFPDKGIAPENFTPEQLQENLDMRKKRCIDNYLLSLATCIVTDMTETGFDLENKITRKFFTHAIEALRAALFASAGVHHPMHKYYTDDDSPNLK